MIKICFVCLGNICRSPMAEYVFKDMIEKRDLSDKYIIESRATSHFEVGRPMFYRTKEKLEEEGIPFGNHVAKQLQKEDYKKFDYFIGMDSNNIKDILSILDKDIYNKVFRFLDITKFKRDVDDPYITGDFDKTYEDVVTGCEELLKKMNK